MTTLWRALIIAGCGIVGTLSGGPAVKRALAGIDRRENSDALVRAGQRLRGGMWIGILERIAVFATIVAGFPHGLAVVAAIKGVGRYPELRSVTDPAVAERFIIGTFISVLWASGFAGLAIWLGGLVD